MLLIALFLAFVSYFAGALVGFHLGVRWGRRPVVRESSLVGPREGGLQEDRRLKPVARSL
jgi:membrane protein DedA with SNARE-associated domain